MKTTLAKANPNGHGLLRLVRFTDEDGSISYYVREPNSQDQDDTVDFDDDLTGAEAYYAERLTFWSKEPNWEAQAAYDERWGTDNGYASWQANRAEY